MTQTLIHLSAARMELSKATALSDVLDIKDKATAIQSYMKSMGESLVVQNQAAELKLRAERRAGEMLAEMDKQHGARTKRSDIVSPRLDELGITKKQSSRWQAEARVADEDFDAFVASMNAGEMELTQAALLKLARGPHVSNNSCDNEWYTPAEYIEPFRSMVGTIDLDPASCAEANDVVKAKRFFSIDDDGLKRLWRGSVWLNPPYGSGVVEPFCEKLITELSKGRTTSAAMLVNNATETRWFQLALSNCNAVCFLQSRVKYWKPNVKTMTPLQGQALMYYGRDPSLFCRSYSEMGCCLHGIMKGD